MDISNSAVKTPDAESETPTRIQPGNKPAPPPSNGLLKRHAPLHLHHGHPVVVSYKECLKNHAAALGGHAIDGCGEFMPSPASNPSDPTSLKCAACGCHRNFHRREPEEPLVPNAALPALEYRPHHRHHPPPPTAPRLGSASPDDSPSPPPISSSYYPSAPHMLLALSHGLSVAQPESGALIPASLPAVMSSGSRKRFRTKFSQNQKEKMLEFAERVGWRMQKKDEDSLNDFCRQVGIEKGVLKVWMHNNKNTLAKKDPKSNTVSTPPPLASNGGGMTADDHHHHLHHDNSILGTDGSSSS